MAEVDSSAASENGGSLEEVRRALRKPELRWSDVATLDLCTAATELMAWLTDPRLYKDVYHASPLVTAIKDFEDIVKKGCGSKVVAALQPELCDTQIALDPLRHKPGADRDFATVVLSALIKRLGEAQVLQAAWQDLWVKCGSSKSPDSVAVRRDLLLALARQAGHDIRWLSFELDGILDNDASTIHKVCTVVPDGIAPYAIDGVPKYGELATLSPLQRVELCGKFLALPPQPRSHVVWLAYERARLRLRIVDALDNTTVDNMAFFHSENVPEDLEMATKKYSKYCHAWTSRDAQILAKDMPHRKGVVLVRVYLTEDTYRDPIQMARDKVEALVAVGKFHAGVSGDNIWRLLPGACYIFPGEYGAQRIPVSCDAEGPRGEQIRQAEVYVEMRNYWAKANGRWSLTELALSEAMELLRWWRDAQGRSPQAQVTANVRVIEVVASRVKSETWQSHLNAYMKAAWIVHTLKADVSSVIFDAFGAEITDIPHTLHDRFRAVWKDAVECTDLGYAKLRPSSMLQALEDLIEILPRNHQARRRLRELRTRLNDANAFKGWIRQLDDQWRRLLDRLERVRDAITHGGPATEGAVTSILHFGSLLAVWEVQITMEAALAGQKLSSAHQEFNSIKTNLLNDLRNAPKPSHLLLS